MADTLKASARVDIFPATDMNSDPALSMNLSCALTGELDYLRTRYDLRSRAIQVLQIPYRDFRGQVYLVVRNLGTTDAEIQVPNKSQAYEPGTDTQSEGDAFIRVPAGGFCFVPLNVNLFFLPTMYAWGVDGPTTIDFLLVGTRVEYP